MQQPPIQFNQIIVISNKTEAPLAAPATIAQAAGKFIERGRPPALVPQNPAVAGGTGYQKEGEQQLLQSLQKST